MNGALTAESSSPYLSTTAAFSRTPINNLNMMGPVSDMDDNASTSSKTRSFLSHCFCCSLRVGVALFAFWQLAGCALNIAWSITLHDSQHDPPLPTVLTALRCLAGVVYSLTITEALVFLQKSIAFYLQYAIGAFFGLLGFVGACLLARRLLAVFLIWTFVNYVIHIVDFVLIILDGSSTVQADVCRDEPSCNDTFQYTFWVVSILRIFVEFYFFLIVRSFWKVSDTSFPKPTESKPLIHSQAEGIYGENGLKDVNDFNDGGDIDDDVGRFGETSINDPQNQDDIPYRGPPKHMQPNNQRYGGGAYSPQYDSPRSEHSEASNHNSPTVAGDSGYKIQLPYICENCLERKRDTIVFPCGHFLYCSQCVTMLTQCGSCNQFITEGKKLG